AETALRLLKRGAGAGCPPQDLQDFIHLAAEPQIEVLVPDVLLRFLLIELRFPPVCLRCLQIVHS
ncbi:Ferredoxin, partial [Dysosmobacter welbionis]